MVFDQCICFKHSNFQIKFLLKYTHTHTHMSLNRIFTYYVFDKPQKQKQKQTLTYFEKCELQFTRKLIITIKSSLMAINLLYVSMYSKCDIYSKFIQNKHFNIAGLVVPWLPQSFFFFHTFSKSYFVNINESMFIGYHWLIQYATSFRNSFVHYK